MKLATRKAWVLVSMFCVGVIAYTLGKPSARKNQSEIQNFVWAIQTPAFNHNEGFVSKYQPSHGYVERRLASNSSPLTWCQKVNESISALGGRVVGECKSPTGNQPILISEFCRGKNDGELYFVGGADPDFIYSIQLGWGAPNQQRCGSNSGTH